MNCNSLYMLLRNTYFKFADQSLDAKSFVIIDAAFTRGNVYVTEKLENGGFTFGHYLVYGCRSMCKELLKYSVQIKGVYEFKVEVPSAFGVKKKKTIAVVDTTRMDTDLAIYFYKSVVFLIESIRDSCGEQTLLTVSYSIAEILNNLNTLINKAGFDMEKQGLDAVNKVKEFMKTVCNSLAELEDEANSCISKEFENFCKDIDMRKSLYTTQVSDVVNKRKLLSEKSLGNNINSFL